MIIAFSGAATHPLSLAVIPKVQEADMEVNKDMAGHWTVKEIYISRMEELYIWRVKRKRNVNIRNRNKVDEVVNGYVNEKKEKMRENGNWENDEEQ